jgi:nucleoid-associated protein YgaU
MNVRLAVLGLVIAIAAAVGIGARWYVVQREAAAPEAPPAVAESAPKTVAPMPEDPAQKTARPTFDVVRVEPSGDAIVAGRAIPGSEVELLAGGGVIDRTKANEVGEFVMMPPPLEPGNHELTLKTSEAASRQAVTVSVPEPGKGEVLVVVGEPGKPSKVVQAGAPEGPGAGSLSSVPGLVQGPAGVGTPLRIGAVEAEGGRLFVQGSGPPGAKTIIYLNDSPLAEAQIAPDGRWSLTVAKGLAKGDYKVRIDQVGDAGKVIARAEAPFAAEGAAGGLAAVSATDVPKQEPSSDVSPPPASSPQVAPSETQATASANPVVPQLDTVEVKRGDNLWQISRRVYGEGMRYSIIYEANTDQIRDPDRIYPGQIFVMPGG